MQSDLFYCKITLHVLGVHSTHHQEYTKLTAASGTGHNIVTATSLSNLATLEREVAVLIL